MIGRIVRQLRALRRWRQIERDLADELALHAELRARALDTADPRRDARLSIGNPSVIVDEMRDVSGWTTVESLVQDLRVALRSFCAHPVFAASAVLTLALGIGANAAIFTLLNAMLFKPLAVPHPEELIRIVYHGAEPREVFCYPAFSAIAAGQHTLEGLFTWNATRLSMGYGTDAHVLDAAVTTGAAYRTLGITAQIGRLLTPEDDAPGAPPVAVISDEFWTAEFHRVPSVIGRTLLLERVPFTVVGVTPRSFHGVTVGAAPRVTIPFHANAALHPRWNMVEGRSTWWLSVLARVRPGVPLEAVRADLTAITGQVIEAGIPQGADPADIREFAASYRLSADAASTGMDFATARYRRPLLVLVAISALVLLMACFNLANLLLARATARRHEMSLRLSLGASRWRLVRQVATESALLLAAGAAVGGTLAWWTAAATARALSLSLDLTPDLRVLAVLGGASIAAGLLFSIGPLVRGTDLDATDALRGSRIGAPGPRRARLGNVLITAQVAVSLVLLIGALLFTKSFSNLRSQETGFRRNQLLFAELNTERAGFNPATQAAFYTRLLDDVRALPGVRGAALTAVLPTNGSGTWDELSKAFWPSLTTDQRTIYFHRVSPGYFRTMGTALVRGRDFELSDRDVAILNEAAARAYFPGRDPIGQVFRVDDKHAWTIIGVAANARYMDLRAPAPRTLYRPAITANTLGVHEIGGGNVWTLVLRGDPPALEALRTLVRGSGKDVVMQRAMAFDEMIDRQLLAERLTAGVASAFAVLALLLAAIGLYGVLAFATARRTSEIGVRMALGATRRSVLWLVLRRAIGVTLAGAIIGVPASLAASRAIVSLLYGVQPADPWILAGATLTLFAVATLAALLPAWRAARINPTVALRWE